MDEIKNIYVALSRLYNISAERVITTDDIDEVCNSFEIFAFKDEVTTIAEKLMIVGHTGAIYYGFTEPDIA